MKVVVIGAGLMGSGIAQCSILAGYNTLLFDVHEAALSNGVTSIKKELQKGVDKGKVTAEQRDQALDLLNTTVNSKDLIGDLIIEAVVEKLEVKKVLFAQLEAINNPSALFGTNTSSIPITQIASGLLHPERIVGIHFFNPAHIMKLVEIVSGAHTQKAFSSKASEWAKSLGKTVVETKDSPGFIVNRVARHYYVEALKILEEGVATVEEIDHLCEASGFKMGPFRLMDLIGVETNFSVTSSMYEQFHFEGKFRPSRIQKQKVDAGFHGRKTGRGFYEYPKEP